MREVIIGTEHKCSRCSPNLFAWLVDSFELCSMNTDSEVILMALQKERDELDSKILQVDRIIKRVKSLGYSNDEYNEPVNELDTTSSPKQLAATVNTFPATGDIKLQILFIFDLLKVAVRLSEIQTEYHKLTGNAYNIRETVRSLHRAGLLRMMRRKDSTHSICWVKTDWITNGQLADN
jgi:hypothetical protein